MYIFRHIENNCTKFGDFNFDTDIRLEKFLIIFSISRRYSDINNVSTHNNGSTHNAIYARFIQTNN